LAISRDRLEELLEKAQDAKVAVVGDLYLDRYGMGAMEGIAREAPVPIVRLRGAKSNYYSPGGGANVCANVADLGPKTFPITVFGDDLHGFELTNQLQARRMDTRFIAKDNGRVTPTFEKFYATAHGSKPQQVGRVDIENINRIARETEDSIIANLGEASRMVDAIIVADYADTPGTWVVTERVLDEIVRIGDETEIPIVSDSRTRIQLFKNTIAVPNEFETAVATGVYEEAMEGQVPDDAADRAGVLLSKMLERPVCMTRGEKPMTIFEGETLERIPAVLLKGEVDTCGAGDTVDAGFAAALAAGATIYEAAEIGDMAAHVTVQKIGTTGTATPREMLAFYDEHLSGR
jgi:rfaE bifunctional protein kinase chain/domain